MRRILFASFLALGLSACSGSETADSGSGVEPGQEPAASEKKDDQDSGKKKPEKLDCSTLQSTGLAVGDVVPDLVLRDGDGKEVHLHDYCNESVILIASEH